MSVHTQDAHHQTDDHAADGYDHGSYKSYFTGFVLSVILTAIPFAVVMSGGLESRLMTVLLVVGFAAVQIVVHMIYFLHMNTRSDEGWTFMSMVFTIIILVVVLAGSIWVMYHMNTNMMPTMDHEALGIGS